ETHLIRLSDLLQAVPAFKDLPQAGRSAEDERLKRHMDAGTEFRERTGRGDALAVYSLGAIRDERAGISGDPTAPARGHAYVLRSLKHPDEAETLHGYT